MAITQGIVECQNEKTAERIMLLGIKYHAKMMKDNAVIKPGN